MYNSAEKLGLLINLTVQNSTMRVLLNVSTGQLEIHKHFEIMKSYCANERSKNIST